MSDELSTQTALSTDLQNKLDAFRENQTALEYLTKEYIPQRFISYEVAENDSFTTIARKVYGSVQKSFFVLHYSRIPSESAYT